MEQSSSHGESDFPWGFAFDPAANVRALGDVQRRGLHAAGQAVDRLLSTMDPGGARAGPAAGDHGTEGRRDGSDSDIGRLAALWTELVTSGLSEMMRLGSPAGQNGSGTIHTDSEARAWVDVGSGQSAGSVEVEADPSGSTRTPGEVWLHNHSGGPLGPVRLHSGELRSPDGVTIPSAAVRFDPPVVEELPERSSRGVGVSLGADRPPAPGVYRGIIQAVGAPAVAIKIELTVQTT
jgi:hypothetical protein